MTYEEKNWSSGRIAFEVYNRSVSAGASQLKWEDLPDSQQEAWELAAQEVIEDDRSDPTDEDIDDWVWGSFQLS
jgi:hypothetical protein